MIIPIQLQKEDIRFCLLKKGEKKPFEKNWQNNGYKFDDPKLLDWINSKEGNYGVIGGYGNLRIIDCDNKEFAEQIQNKIGDTFSVLTGSGNGMHYYIFSSYNKNHVFKDNVGEFRANNYQVVGASCIHPSGGIYKILNDSKIKKIEEEIVAAILEPYIRQEFLETIVDKPKDESRSGKEFREIIKLIYKGLSKEDVFKEMEYFAKWSTAHPTYKELSYNKALKYVESHPTFSDAPSPYIDSIYNKLNQTGGVLETGIKEVNLSSVYKTYDKWLYLEDYDRVDLVLAIALSHKTKSPTNPLWLFLVAPSGDMKSEQIRALENWKNSKFLSTITSKTFINGFPRIKDEILNLNNKLIITTDLGPMLQMQRDEKVEIWAQLRDLYDGYICKTFGTGKRSEYRGIFFTWIAGSTPIIDDQLLLKEILGTRELLYRIDDMKNKEELKKKIRIGLMNEIKMREELSQITINFLEKREYKELEVSDYIFKKLGDMSSYLCYMRASATSDAFSGELINFVYPEQPTRILKQLIKVYCALKSLDDNYKDEDALRIIERIVRSSASQFRIKVFDFFIENKNKELSLSHVSQVLKLGKKTTYRELNTLWNMGLLNRRYEEITYGFDNKPSGREVYYFSLNLEDEFILGLIEESKDANQP